MGRQRKQPKGTVSTLHRREGKKSIQPVLQRLVPVILGEHVVRHRGEPYVVLEVVAQALQLDWAQVHQELAASPARWELVPMMVSLGDGGTPRLSACLPLHHLPAWLATLEAVEVQHQREAAEAQLRAAHQELEEAHKVLEASRQRSASSLREIVGRLHRAADTAHDTAGRRDTLRSGEISEDTYGEGLPVAEGRFGADPNDRGQPGDDDDDGWRTAEELAADWGVPEEAITEIAEKLGLHDDPTMSRPVRIARPPTRRRT